MNWSRTSRLLWTSMKYIKLQTYGIILICLFLFCGFGFAYFYVPSPFQAVTPQYISTSTLTATSVTCGFPLSGQYGLVPTTTYFVLVPLIIFLRSHQWLSAGSAVWVMTYAAVSVLHLVVLFVFNNRWAEDPQRNYCDRIALDEDFEISICHGVHDPDYILAGGLIAAGLLAVLPLWRWSYTFKTAEARPILVLWTLLLAIGHIFFILVLPNPNLNYQICPAGYEEPIPRLSYNAGNYDASWQNAFYSILRNESAIEEDGGSRCIYSCFAVYGYLGRQPSEIGIFESSISNRYVSLTFRILGTAFWLIYAVLSVAAVLTNKPHDQHWPRTQLSSETVASLRRFVAFVTLWQHLVKPQDRPRWRRVWAVASLSSCRVRIRSSRIWLTISFFSQVIHIFATIYLSRIWLRMQDKIRREFETEQGFSWKCGTCLLRRTVQILSVCSYPGYVAYLYVEVLQLPNAESPSAVGQWGSVAAIFLALVAAAVSWISTKRL